MSLGDVLMTQKLVSIIIPVFNREEIVGKTIESVQTQTYQNLEIIIIDDGSTDDSYTKCSEYAEKDERIVLIKKRNGGVSSARNKGLNIIRGEYVFFLDDDDYIYKDAIEKLVECAEKFSCDIVQGNKRCISGNLEGIKKMSYLEYLRTDFYMPVVWGKLYRSILLKGVWFDETLTISEDADFLFKLIGYADEIICCDGDFMGTTFTEVGLNREEYSENSLLIITVLERAIERLKKINDEEFARYIYRSYGGALFSNYVNAKKYRINNYRIIRKKIQKKYRGIFWQIIKANNGGWQSKMACILGWINLDIYRIKI